MRILFCHFFYNKILSRDIVEKDIQDLADKFGLIDILNKKISRLSGGQKQRVAIIRSLVLNPQTILADEPTANLDNVELVIAILQEQQKDGKIVIVATHDDRLCSFANKIYHIQNGHLFN